MDGERGPVEAACSVHDFTAMIDQQQIRHSNMAEMLAVGIDPEMVGQLRIASGDGSGHALIESETGKQPEGSRQTLFPVLTLFGEAGENRRFRRGEWGHVGSDHFDNYSRIAGSPTRLR